VSSGESLHLIVEASLALAGFAGVVTALTRRGARELPALHRLSLMNLLATSFGALFLSLAALVLLAAGAGEPIVWRIVSGAGLLVTLYFATVSIRTVLSNTEEQRRRQSTSALLAVNVPLLVVCGLQAWNLAVLAAFWPVLLLLVALFGVGCYSFVQLVYASA